MRFLRKAHRIVLFASKSKFTLITDLLFDQKFVSVGFQILEYGEDDSEKWHR